VLALQAAMQVDIMERGDEAARKAADELLGFLTPIVKGCLTEWGNECAYHALQCFGGHGYVRESGMEQLARDARITTIYEGTTGIQAMDLLGRKIIQLQGAGMRQFLGLIQKFCTEHMADAEMIEFVLPLAEVTKQWGELTMQLARKSQESADEIGAASVDYLFYSGYATLAYWWARSVSVAEAGSHGNDFKRRKREVARFYFARILPRINAHAAAMKSGAKNLMALPDSAFVA
jgi:hypothetical protein